MRKHDWISLPAILAVVFNLNGCASFEPRLDQGGLSKARLPTVKANQQGVDVSIEEFVNPEKSLQAFESVVASYGVLPLLVRVDNNGTTNYRLPRGNVKAKLGGDSLTLLEARQAAVQGAAKDYGGRALAWTLATGPFALLLAPLTMTGSSAHTAAVNRKIESHFGALELPDALVRQKESIAGFVYFKLPVASWKLDDLVVEVEPINDDSGEVLSYKFALPVLDIPVPREMQGKTPREDG